jgi:SAM-dependent methyltransferase
VRQYSWRTNSARVRRLAPFSFRVVRDLCIAGVLTRFLGTQPEVELVVGVILAPTLLARAENLTTDGCITYRQADGRDLPFAEPTFDVVIFDSVLCHVSEPQLALEEARRVLAPSGVSQSSTETTRQPRRHWAILIHCSTASTR